MGASATMGFVFKLLANHQENKRDEFKMMMAQHTRVEESRKNARKHQSAGSAFIRRFITITMMSLLTFLVVAPTIDPSITTNIITEIERPSFFGFGGGKEIIVTVVSGMLYDDTIRSILSSIVGYYFGSSTAQRR